MLRSIRRWWRYLGARLGMQLDEVADPKVQLEQAIQEAREQHRLLTENAASVIANQAQLQQRLDRAIDEYEKANGLARQALILSDRETRKGEVQRADNLGMAAESFAERIILLEREVEEVKRLLIEATQASERARQAVRLNSIALRKKLAQRERLLSQLDQAKMQEQMNAAMAQLDASVGEEVPTLDEVRDKIERRLAMAHATNEVKGSSVSVRVLEVEQAMQQAEAQARLGVLRAQLGLAPPPIAGELQASPDVIEGDLTVLASETREVVKVERRDP
jgi:phage shock protein A